MPGASHKFQAFFDPDGSLDPLRGGRCAVLGYGNQGKAHALNARDSGLDVIVANRGDSPNGRAAAGAGFELLSVAEAVRASDFIVVALPDEAQPAVFAESIAPNLRSGQALCFVHGYNIHFKSFAPPSGVDVVLVAPKGAGYMVRGAYEKGSGIPCLLAVHNDATGRARERAMAWAIAIGGGRAGCIWTTFADECEMDLFGEQAVLCGGVTALVKTGFEVLLEAGYPPEVAYFEVCHELKLIVDLIHAGGLKKMHESISRTASYGGLTTGPKIIDESVKQRMRAVLGDIQSGAFAAAWSREHKSGSKEYQRLRDEELNHALEQARSRLAETLPGFGAPSRNEPSRCTSG